MLAVSAFINRLLGYAEEEQYAAQVLDVADVIDSEGRELANWRPSRAKLMLGALTLAVVGSALFGWNSAKASISEGVSVLDKAPADFPSGQMTGVLDLYGHRKTVESFPQAPSSPVSEGASASAANRPVSTPALDVMLATPDERQPVVVNRPSQQALDYIGEASAISGVDRNMLLAIANQESSFRVDAVSSIGARGLFQVTNRTWAELVRKYGKPLGISIKDHKDPRKNAILGALYVRDMVASMTRALGRPPSITDVYAAHFLGPTGARTLLKAPPTAVAATVLPAAAKHNPAIFYKKSGEPRTASEVYQVLYGKVDRQYVQFTQASGATPVFSATFKTTQVASATPSPVASVTPSANVAYPTEVARPTTSYTPQQVTFAVPDRPVQVGRKEHDYADAVPTRSGVAVVASKQGLVEHNFIKRADGRLVTLS